MISLLHPTVRPHAWENAAQAWYARCDNPDGVEYILVPEQSRFIESLYGLKMKVPFGHSVVEWNTHAANEGGCFNCAAELSTGDVLVTMADDLTPPEHWDTTLLRVLGDKINGEAAVWGASGDASLDSWTIVHPILTRAYYEKLGYIFWHEYNAHYLDVEFHEVAARNGVIIDAREALKFVHKNFDNDEFHKQHADHHEEDRIVFERRKAGGFQ